MTSARSVLVICSGNTCRSPLAAALLAARLARDPALREIQVASAGTSAWDGSPASEGSYLVGLERGLDLSTHRARLLTSDLVQRADLILTMSEAHAHRVADMGGAMKVHTWTGYAEVDGTPREVPDPFGGDVRHYREMADLLESVVDAIVARLRQELVA